MTDELTLVDAVPALADFNLSPEMHATLSEMLASMTTPPEGIHDTDWRWEPELVKIKAATTSDPKCPGHTELGDLWTPSQVLWSADNDGPKKPWGFIPVEYWWSHAMFEAGGGSNRPECSSDNGIITREGLLCADCKHLPWKGSAKLYPGKAQTACANARNFLVLDAKLTGFYHLRLSGGSNKAANDMLRAVKGSLSGRVWGLTSTPVERKGKKWREYAMSMTGEAVDPAIVAFCAMVRGHKAAQIQDEVANLMIERDEALAIASGDLADPDAIDALQDAVEGPGGFSESM